MDVVDRRRSWSWISSMDMRADAHWMMDGRCMVHAHILKWRVLPAIKPREKMRYAHVGIGMVWENSRVCWRGFMPTRGSSTYHL